jgi:tetratricopeptide (TPR) repeat protein
MKTACLTTIAFVAITSCSSWGETPLPVTVNRTGSVEVVCPTANEEARRSYDDALQLQQQGMLREAEASYLKAIGLDPRYCDAMDNLGQMLRSQGKTDQAISWYKRSLSVKPDDAVAHQDLAVAYIVLGDADKSVAEFQWLIQHDPGNPEGYYGLGNVQVTTGHPADAIGPLERAEQLYRAKGSPLLADTRYELGVAHYLLKEYGKARDYFELVYPGREKDPTINHILGLCYLDSSIKDPAKARQYLLKARKLGAEIPPDLMQQLDK